MDKRTLTYTAFGIFVIIGVYFLFTAPQENGNSVDEAGQDSDAVAALFGGGDSSYHEGENPDSESVFESDFWKSGVSDDPIEDVQEVNEDDPDILDPVSEGNPVNPQTGKPYTDSMMKQFDKLREKFPDNSILPRRMSPEEKEKENETRKEMNNIRGKIIRKKATEDQVNRYWDDRVKKTQDRLELLEYVVNEQGDKMSDKIREQYEKVLEMSRNQLESYKKQRERDLNRNKE